MKTSEQMTRDVLARRDKAIKDRAAARRRMMRIGVPCAACLALAVICTTDIVARSNNGLEGAGNKEIAYITNSNGEKVGYYIDSDGEIRYIHNAIGKPTTDDIRFNESGKNSTDSSHSIDLSDRTFKPMTLAELNAYYGTRLTLLSEKYPDWTFSGGNYGVYTDDNDNEVWKQNSVSFTSPDGNKWIYIDLNKDALPYNCITGGDFETSTIYENEVVLFKILPDKDINIFSAQFMMHGSGVRIYTHGIGADEFIDIVREYVSYPDFRSSAPGQTKTAIIDVDKFNIPAIPELDPNELREMTMNAVNRSFRVELDRLTVIHPEWTESHGKLGTYRHEENDGVTASMSIYYTTNTINYVTEKGAKISVSVQQGQFAPVSDETFTEDKPVSRPAASTIIEYDENGNVIGMTTPGYNPDNAPAGKPAPDNGVSTVNGYEAIICRDANGNYLADVKMNSRVRITAEGVSESEFIELLNEFTL